MNNFKHIKKNTFDNSKNSQFFIFWGFFPNIWNEIHKFKRLFGDKNGRRTRFLLLNLWLFIFSLNKVFRYITNYQQLLLLLPCSYWNIRFSIEQSTNLHLYLLRCNFTGFLHMIQMFHGILKWRIAFREIKQWHFFWYININNKEKEMISRHPKYKTVKTLSVLTFLIF